MRLALAAAAFFVLGGVGVTYALMGNNSAPPQKTSAGSKNPGIPKNETATLALLSSPKSDQVGKFWAAPVPSVAVPVKAKPKLKANAKSTAGKRVTTSAKSKAKPRPPLQI